MTMTDSGAEFRGRIDDTITGTIGATPMFHDPEA